MEEHGHLCTDNLTKISMAARITVDNLTDRSIRLRASGYGPLTIPEYET